MQSVACGTSKGFTDGKGVSHAWVEGTNAIVPGGDARAAPIGRFTVGSAMVKENAMSCNGMGSVTRDQFIHICIIFLCVFYFCMETGGKFSASHYDYAQGIRQHGQWPLHHSIGCLVRCLLVQLAVVVPLCRVHIGMAWGHCTIA